MKAGHLMKNALDSKLSTEKRAKLFDRIYEEYVRENGNDNGWDNYRTKLRGAYSNKLSKKQEVKFGINRESIRRAYAELQKNIKKRNHFPVELFYENSFSIIKKIIKKGDKFLEIGYGDCPLLINLLNKRGYSAYGMEPFPKEFDDNRTFRATMKNIPDRLIDKYDLILINMVYSVNYTQQLKKNFKWELRNKSKLISRISKLLNKQGYLILIDDIGTIFDEKDLKKYFQIILFEKDIPVINFMTNKTDDFGKLTLLRRK